MLLFDRNETLVLEAELKLYELGYDTTQIQQETGVITYEWSETMNDLRELGIDTDKLDTEKFYGYDTNTNEEVTLSDYTSMLLNIVGKVMRDEGL